MSIPRPVFWLRAEDRSMSTPATSKSLLERARDPSDSSSWRKLVDLYLPLIRRWIRPRVRQPADLDDVVQDVLTKLASELRGFKHNKRPGAFRAWLRALTANRLRVHWRQRGQGSGSPELQDQLNQLEDPNSPLSRAWDEEHDRHVTRTQYQVARNLEVSFQRRTGGDDLSQRQSEALKAAFALEELRQIAGQVRVLVDP